MVSPVSCHCQVAPGDGCQTPAPGARGAVSVASNTVPSSSSAAPHAADSSNTSPTKTGPLKSVCIASKTDKPSLEEHLTRGEARGVRPLRRESEAVPQKLSFRGFPGWVGTTNLRFSVLVSDDTHRQPLIPRESARPATGRAAGRRRYPCRQRCRRGRAAPGWP